MHPSLDSRRSLLRLTAALFVAVATTAGHISTQAQGAATPPMTQVSSAGGVTVKVTPRPVSPSSGEWAFSVVLDTHSQELDDDLASTAVLTVDGQEFRPLRWSGAAPGGHHREGVLDFPAPAGEAGTVELRVQRPAEAAPRVFRWDGAALR